MRIQLAGGPHRGVFYAGLIRFEDGAAEASEEQLADLRQYGYRVEPEQDVAEAAAPKPKARHKRAAKESEDATLEAPPAAGPANRAD